MNIAAATINTDWATTSRLMAITANLCTVDIVASFKTFFTAALSLALYGRIMKQLGAAEVAILTMVSVLKLDTQLTVVNVIALCSFDGLFWLLLPKS